MSPSRLLIALALAGASWAMDAVAQTPAASGAASQQSCVDVQIGTEQYYNCLNHRLQTGIEQHRLTARDAPYSASSPGPAVGTFNQTATRERLGSAFGHSAVPQRPPPPSFASPVVPHH